MSKYDDPKCCNSRVPPLPYSKPYSVPIPLSAWSRSSFLFKHALISNDWTRTAVTVRGRVFGGAIMLYVNTPAQVNNQYIESSCTMACKPCTRLLSIWRRVEQDRSNSCQATSVVLLRNISWRKSIVIIVIVFNKLHFLIDFSGIIFTRCVFAVTDVVRSEPAKGQRYWSLGHFLS